MVKTLFTRAWNSPTIMTWMSYSTKALSLFIVLPLILKQFSAEEISLWYLFSSIITLTSLADLGFKATFSRIIAFAMGGAKDVAIFKGDAVVHHAKPNWKLIEKICSNMNIIYIFLTLLLIVIFFIFGSLSLLTYFFSAKHPRSLDCLVGYHFYIRNKVLWHYLF